MKREYLNKKITNQWKISHSGLYRNIFSSVNKRFDMYKIGNDDDDVVFV